MTVAICDRQLLFADAFAHVLGQRGETAVVVPSPDDVLDALGDAPVASVVLDAGFPGGAALLATRRIRHARPGAVVVCLAEGPEDARLVLNAGADRVLSKRQPLHLLVEAVLWPSNERLHPPAALRQRAAERNSARRPSREQPLPVQFLTKRERDVLVLLTSAETTAGIARRLGISVTTTRGYIQSTFIKLGVHSRVEAVTYAVKHAVVESSER